MEVARKGHKWVVLPLIGMTTPDGLLTLSPFRSAAWMWCSMVLSPPMSV